MHGAISLPIGSIYGIAEDYLMLTQANKPAKDLGQLVADLTIDPIGEKILPCARGVSAVPSRPHEVLEWDAPHQPSGEMRFSIDRKVVQVIEGSFCCCAAFADTDTLVTGSTDFTVRLWKVARGTGRRSHRLKATSLAVISSREKAWHLPGRTLSVRLVPFGPGLPSTIGKN